MKEIPVVGITGFSGSGKTTLIEKLLPLLSSRGIRTAVIKHDAHGLTFDAEGKDSQRFSAAGASCSVVSGPQQTAVFIQKESTLPEALALITDADLILVEGYKKADITQLGISQQDNGKGFTDVPEHFLALITDENIPETGRPVFHPDDIEGIAEFMIQNQNDFTHFNEQGRARMVNVGEKDTTERTALAGASVLVSPETYALIRSGGMKKGDVLTVAQIAGVMGAKRTPDLIPMCHPIVINGIDLQLSLNEEKCSVDITASVSCTGRTGVEMEAMTAVSVAALTVYDMCKAVQKDIVITNVRLLRKSGGVHGDFVREEEK